MDGTLTQWTGKGTILSRPDAGMQSSHREEVRQCRKAASPFAAQIIGAKRGRRSR